MKFCRRFSASPPIFPSIRRRSRCANKHAAGASIVGPGGTCTQQPAGCVRGSPNMLVDAFNALIFGPFLNVAGGNGGENPHKEPPPPFTPRRNYRCKSLIALTCPFAAVRVRSIPLSGRELRRFNLRNDSASSRSSGVLALASTPAAFKDGEEMSAVGGEREESKSSFILSLHAST